MKLLILSYLSFILFIFILLNAAYIK